MKAMILAAGRGQRLGKITDSLPKPLVKVQGKALIEYHVESLAHCNIRDIVINTSYLGEQIQAYLGDGSRYGVSIQYSSEQERLETGGGIFQALPLLGDKPFLVLSADIFTDFDFASLPTSLDHLAHLVLVDNPDYYPQGDFYLTDGMVGNIGKKRLTYGNIGIYSPRLFSQCKPGKFPLASLLFSAISDHQVSGEYFQGRWLNIGTAEVLTKAQKY